MLKDNRRGSGITTLNVCSGILKATKARVNIPIMLIMALMLSAATAPAQTADAPLDVRILVDVSSNMQENDPDNLRLPASNLFIELLPEGSRAGLWTFGRDVNMLVPYGTVNAEWRRVARNRVADIGSPGFNSNVGGAMDTASFDFDWSTGLNPKQFLLLSDGLVDVPPDAAAGLAERQRILNDLLPRFLSRNATIHTVRLSERSDAFFMQQLAAQTGGNNYLAQAPQDMLGILLQVLDIAVGGQEEVTLDARQAFRVDDSISEFTATILHGPGASQGALTLIAPDGERFRQDAPPGRAEWRTSAQYDLITVRQPDAGEWRVEGDLDPGSRITILSDLNLQVDSIPLNAAVNASLPVQAVINDVSGQVTDADFLSLLTVGVSVWEDGEPVSTYPMALRDGMFLTEVALPRDPGTYQIVVEADGQTFQRRRVHTINVRNPIALEINPVGNAYELSVYANLPGIEDDLRRFLAEVQGPNGDVRFLPFSQQPSGQWVARVTPDAGAGVYDVNVDPQFSGGVSTRNDLRVAPVQLSFPVSGSGPITVAIEPPPEVVLTPSVEVAPEIIVPEPEPVSAPEPQIEPEPEPEPVTVVAPISEPTVETPDDNFLAEEPPASGSFLPYLLAAGGGLAAVLLFYGLYRLLAGRQTMVDSSLSAQEQAALRELETGADDDAMAEELAPAAPEPVAADAEAAPTLDDALQEDKASVLDDDFDLESLGIDMGDEDEDLEKLLDGDPDDDMPDGGLDDDEADAEQKASGAGDDAFTSDEFDLSEDEIDDMLDDSLSDEDKK